MSTKKVVVSTPVLFFEEFMDETSVEAYVSDAYTRGFFISPENDIYIPFSTASIVVHDPEREASGRDDIANF